MLKKIKHIKIYLFGMTYYTAMSPASNMVSYTDKGIRTACIYKGRKKQYKDYLLPEEAVTGYDDLSSFGKKI